MSLEVDARKVGLLYMYVHMYNSSTIKHACDKLCMLVDFEEAISSYYQVIAESSPTKQACNNQGE